MNIDKEKMASILSSFQVPVKPKALTEMQEIMGAPEPDINLVADLISSDIGLSSAILKVINSPYYGMSRSISEIKQAVMIIGLTTINSLITALLLKSSLQGKASISLERFLDDSLDVANQGDRTNRSKSHFRCYSSLNHLDLVCFEVSEHIKM